MRKDKMAQVKPIKDSEVVAILASCGKANEPWDAGKHRLAVWKLFRFYGFLKGATPEVLAKAAAVFQAHWDNGHFSYASNQGKHAEVTTGPDGKPICAPARAVVMAAEYN